MGLFRSTVKKVVLVTAIVVGKQILTKVATRLAERALKGSATKTVAEIPRITQK